MLIGIYGGTFDPIHTGHAIIASYLAQWCGFDRIWFMVSPQNPLKNEHPSVSDEDRLKMCRIVADKIKNVEVSDFEFSLPVPSYMCDTLDALSARFPQHRFRLIIGSDNWSVFKCWKNPERIIERYGVTVYPRPGFERPVDLPSGVEWLEEAPQIVMSSNFIRRALGEGKDVSYMIPVDVANFISDKALYSRGKREDVIENQI